MKRKKIIAQIQNNTAVDVPISIFGGPFDQNANTVNTHNMYSWDVTGQTYTGLIIFTIQYRKVGVIPYTTLSMAVPGSFEDAVRILNLQGLGRFWAESFVVGPFKIYTMSDTLQFNQLSMA